MELTKKELLAQKITAAATEDQEFFKAFIGAQDAPALQKVLQNNGFEFTLEEIDEFFANGVDGILAHNGSAELTEDQLDDVAGGRLGGAIVGGTTAYLYYRAKGYSVAQALKMAAKHGYHGYTKLSW